MRYFSSKLKVEGMKRQGGENHWDVKGKNKEEKGGARREKWEGRMRTLDPRW